MKRVFILITILTACLSQMFAQLAITNQGGDNIANTTINIAPNGELSFYVKNTSSETISNIKAYLRVQDGDYYNGAVYYDSESESAGDADADWSFCSTSCGLNGGCPKFQLAPDAQQEIHLAFKAINHFVDYTVFVYPTGDEQSAVSFKLHPVTTGIANVSSNVLNVYPSPADESFTIENGFGKNCSIEIYNVLGQMVKRISNDSNRVSVNCSTWKNGYYVCRAVKDGKIEKTIKIVIAH